MKDNRMKDALDTIARRGVPENFNLWPNISAQLERKTLMMMLRTRPILLILTILLVLTLLTGVAYAIGKSLGYIPGVGLIEQGTPIRVLKEPVSVTRDGVTVTINRAVLTSDKTDMAYYVSGVPSSAYPEGEAVTGDCIDERSEPYLRLPDGTRIYAGRFLTTPVPADVNEAVFVMPCIFNTLPGTVPENWELPLQFVPAPPEFTVIPVTILPALSPEPIVTASAENPLAITKVLDIGDSFVLMGEFRYDALGTVSQANVFADGSWWWVKGIKAIDSIGSEIPIPGNYDVEWPAPSQPNTDVWVYQIDKNFVPPLTINYEVQHVIPVGAEEQAEISFDAGTNPQAGNEWAVNKDFKMGGYNIRLVSISSGSQVYSFQFRADPGASANSISVDIAGYGPNCGGGGGPEVFPEEFSREFCFTEVPGSSGEFPKGNLKAVIRFQALKRENQTFQLEWSPNTAEPFVTPTPRPDVCLTLEKWNQLTGQNDALPTGVSGKIVTTINEGGPLPAIYISSPDGTNLQKIGIGAWPSLSSNGTQLVYSASDGLRVVNLSSGQSSAFGVDGYRLIWLPDDSRMMYTTTFGLYVVNADGSGLQQVNIPSAQVIALVGWLPDNQTVVYSVLSGDGFDLKPTTCKMVKRRTCSRSAIRQATARFRPMGNGSFSQTVSSVRPTGASSLRGWTAPSANWSWNLKFQLRLCRFGVLIDSG